MIHYCAVLRVKDGESSRVVVVQGESLSGWCAIGAALEQAMTEHELRIDQILELLSLSAVKEKI